MTKFLGILICVVLYTIGRYLLGVYITASLFLFHVVGVPLIFKYSKTFRRMLVFANFVQWPPNLDLEDPSSRGVNGARNVNIEYDSKVDNCKIKIGFWHILPFTRSESLKNTLKTADKEELNKILDNELVNSQYPIVVYCHGNSNSRAAQHRVKLYKFFQKMEFHTIAFDYRGYGDSTAIQPSESGVVEDALIVYDWLCSTLSRSDKRPNVYVWGHSLGTGISSHLLGNLDTLSKSILHRQNSLPLPNGLILEAPFNNLADEVNHHPLAILVTWLPYHEATFLAPFRVASEYTFKSDEHLSRVNNLPILILHAKDDYVVPFVVGVKLYKSVLESRQNGGATIKLQAFEKKEGLGHKFICDGIGLSEVIRDFVSNH